MEAEDINKPLLNVEYNKEDEKWHFEIKLNDKIMLVSPVGFKTQKECRIYLVELDYCFRNLQINGELGKF